MKAKVKTWLKNIENGTLKSYSEKVLQVIKNHTIEGNGVSTFQLRRRMEMTHQTLTSRLSELNDEGLINVKGQVEINDTFYSVYIYIDNEEQRLNIIKERMLEKYIQWLKKADSFTNLMGFKTVDMIHQEQKENNCY